MCFSILGRERGRVLWSLRTVNLVQGEVYDGADGRLKIN